MEDLNELREHPRLAAEVVYGVERVDSRKPSILEADDQASVVLSQGHAIGMLSNQNEVRFEGSHNFGAISHNLHVHHAASGDISSQVQLRELSLFHPDLNVAIHFLPMKIFRPVCVGIIDDQQDPGSLNHRCDRSWWFH